MLEFLLYFTLIVSILVTLAFTVIALVFVLPECCKWLKDYLQQLWPRLLSFLRSFGVVRLFFNCWKYFRNSGRKLPSFEFPPKVHSLLLPLVSRGVDVITQSKEKLSTWRSSLRDFLQKVSPAFSKDCLPHFCHNLRMDLVWGLSIAVLMLFFHGIPIVKKFEEMAMDGVMSIHKNLIPPPKEEKFPAFVALDIDNDTYKEWNEPLLTPRNHLTQLIKGAVDGGARLVIVDINLSRETPMEISQIECSNISKGHPFDQELLGYLEKHNEECQKKSKEKECPIIIFARDLSSDSVDASIATIRQKEFLSAVVNEKSKPYLLWGSPLFIRSALEQNVRHWSLWQRVVIGQQVELIPSMELLAAARIANPSSSGDAIIKSLNDELEKQTEKSSDQMEIGNLKIPIEKGIHQYQRIMYRFSWSVPDPETGEESPVLPRRVCDEDHINDCGEENFRLYSIDIKTFLENREKSGKDYLTNLMAGKVVIIGGSYYDGTDIHQTPIGTMPGYMVIVNAIYSLLNDDMRPLSPAWKLLIEALLITLMSLLLTCSSSILGKLFSTVIIIFILLAISVLLFESGFWLDFVLPLFGVLVHQFHDLNHQFHKLQCRIEELENTKKS